MGENRLRSLLTDLHGELSGAESVDAKDRELLGQVMDDIEGVLDGRSSLGEDEESLNDRLDRGVVRFENRHPRFSFILERMIETLSNMGI